MFVFFTLSDLLYFTIISSDVIFCIIHIFQSKNYENHKTVIQMLKMVLIMCEIILKMREINNVENAGKIT